MFSKLKIQIINVISVMFKKNVISALILINMLLAVTALLKDVFLASYLGTTSNADALTLALFVPDTLGNLLFAASINMSCVPVFSMLFVNYKLDRLKKCFKNINVVVIIISLFMSGLLFVFRQAIMGSLGNSLSPQIIKTYVQLFSIILPIIIFYPLLYAGVSIMQVYGKFIIPAWAPVLYNGMFLSSIFCMYILKIPSTKGVYIIALAITLGVIGMFIMILQAVSKLNISFFDLGSKSINLLKLPRNEINDLRAILKIFLPYLLIIISTQTVFFFERFIASGQGVGSVAALSYAFRLAQFPIWVFVAAISTVILPSMSKLNGKGQAEELRKKIIKAFKTVLLFSIPMTTILYILRIPIITILFERGAFDSNSLNITADILQGYALAIIGQSLWAVCLRYFMAVGKTGLPLLSCVCAVIINIILDFYLTSKIGLSGLGYGAAIGATINAGIMLVGVMCNVDTSKKYNLLQKVILNIRIYLQPFCRIIISNFPLLLLTLLFSRLWQTVLNISCFYRYWVYVLIVVMSCSIVYWFSLQYCKVIIRGGKKSEGHTSDHSGL